MAGWLPGWLDNVRRTSSIQSTTTCPIHLHCMPSPGVAYAVLRTTINPRHVNLSRTTEASGPFARVLNHLPYLPARSPLDPTQPGNPEFQSACFVLASGPQSPNNSTSSPPLPTSRPDGLHFDVGRSRATRSATAREWTPHTDAGIRLVDWNPMYLYYAPYNIALHAYVLDPSVATSDRHPLYISTVL